VCEYLPVMYLFDFSHQVRGEVDAGREILKKAREQHPSSLSLVLVRTLCVCMCVYASLRMCAYVMFDFACMHEDTHTLHCQV
jgi:hypothetical protein